jgi:RNA 3'-terminal phosphate cyclase (ATP)
MQFDHVSELVAAFGQRGVPAEKVAKAALKEARQFLRSPAAVGQHLADQLLLPLGIGAARGTGGGCFRTSRLSSHTTTHVELLTRFLAIQISIEEQGADDFLIQVSKA